jgi:hypothetical protein
MTILLTINLKGDIYQQVMRLNHLNRQGSLFPGSLQGLRILSTKPQHHARQQLHSSGDFTPEWHANWESMFLTSVAWPAESEGPKLRKKP